ncbi:hypothetical protein [Enemella sp. A6]|uniref:hypothetical protein n=1 Tax=Enemella sp. A6 TaxID=3440152 RepID=UPI003EB7516C
MSKQPKTPAGDRRDLPEKFGKEVRLWGLSFVCAALGALAVWYFDNLLAGIGVFLISLIILGGLLYGYEKRRGEARR